MDSFNRQQIGNAAEHLACEFLQAKGFALLLRNYRCYLGEIDLIMRDGEDIVFIEVRSRQRTDYGNAFDSITTRKQAKLVKAAKHFLQAKQWLYRVNSRFDVVAIHPVAGEMKIEWIKHAFEAKS